MVKPYMGFLHFFVFHLCLVISVHSQSSPDAASMQALKLNLKLPAGLDWSSSDPCQWSQVQCDKSNRVTLIQIGNKNVGGTLPPDLKNLSSLLKLELMGNAISGPLPSLAGLGSLQELNLHDNHFTSFPSDFFTGMNSLQHVFLDKNPFASWQIPDSVKDATGLQNFSANSCNISGVIPAFFGGETFPGLVNLHLSMNLLTGELPASFSGSNIQSLWLNGQQDDSKLNGTIEVLKNMTSLQQVWLHGNQFSGPIPDLSGLTSLYDFSVRDNQLTGIVPPSVTTLPSLSVVNFTNNLLQGPTPKFDNLKVQVDMNEGSNSFCLNDPGVACDPRIGVLLSIVEPLGYPVKFADNWKSNDPCKSWLGISCSGGNITVVNFKNMGISGTISPNFAQLTSLQVLNLAGNDLTGSIPKELTLLVNLRSFDVSNNRLYGPVPVFSQNVVLNTAGNPDLGKDVGQGQSPPKPGGQSPTAPAGGKAVPPGETVPPPKKSMTVPIVASAIVSVVFLIGVGFCCWFVKKRKQSGVVQTPHAIVIHPHHSGDQDGLKVTAAGGPLNVQVGGGSEHYSLNGSGPTIVEAGSIVISIQILKSVTNNFSDDNILGRGGFGTVYKGELHDGTKIAVKRMESSALGDTGLKEFKAEIAVLTKVRHRHLVALIGYCLEDGEKLLVYEYMPQGTLTQHLFRSKDDDGRMFKPLEWTRRLCIALDVARGVEYLHSLAQQTFIHRDLKPSNILLDDNMRAKVADFGLVRLAPDGKQSIETRLAGTFGYLAPEYATTGRITTKVDVFSFGIILLELISGRRAIDDSLPEDIVHLPSWFRKMHNTEEAFKNTIDSTINLDEETLTSIGTITELAGHCTAKEPYQRPDMGHVVNVLSSIVEQWEPSKPESDNIFGIDYDKPLQDKVNEWKMEEGKSNIDYSSPSLDNGSRSGYNSNTSTAVEFPGGGRPIDAR